MYPEYLKSKSHGLGRSLLEGILECDLHSEGGVHAGSAGPTGRGISRSVDAGETTCSFMDHLVLWLLSVSQAQQLRLRPRNCANLERVWSRRYAHSFRVDSVFEIEPVVAILQAEDMSLNIIGGTANFRVQLEFDQPALNREQTARQGWLIGSSELA